MVGMGNDRTQVVTGCSLEFEAAQSIELLLMMLHNSLVGVLMGDSN